MNVCIKSDLLVRLQKSPEDWETQLDSSVWAQHVPPDNESMQSSVVSLSQWIYWSQVRLLLTTNKCRHEKKRILRRFTETHSVFHKCCVFVTEAVFCEILRLMKSFCVSWNVVAFFYSIKSFLCFLSCFFLYVVVLKLQSVNIFCYIC